MTVSQLLQAVGFDPPGNDIDETLKWALVKLYLLEKEDRDE